MDPILGQIILFAGNFAPQGWAFCNGQLIAIQSNQALFALLGTTYGGNGQTTFGLPDLRGRAPIHFGQGPGLSTFNLGQTGGEENVTLRQSEIPSHSHSFAPGCNSGSVGVQGSPANGYVGAQDGPYYASAANAQMGTGNSQAVGGGQPHENRPPFIAMNYIICIVGIYPDRS